MKLYSLLVALCLLPGCGDWVTDPTPHAAAGAASGEASPSCDLYVPQDEALAMACAKSMPTGTLYKCSRDKSENDDTPIKGCKHFKDSSEDEPLLPIWCCHEPAI